MRDFMIIDVCTVAFIYLRLFGSVDHDDDDEMLCRSRRRVGDDAYTYILGNYTAGGTCVCPLTRILLAIIYCCVVPTR